MFEAARKAADPAVCVPPFLPAAPVRKDGSWGRTIVVGAGKAAASMARAVEQAWPEKNHDAPLEGLVEIGRASCRERVCQYVSISVVAVSLKKKNIYIANTFTRHNTHITIHTPLPISQYYTTRY